jgi:hypothetical protein
MPDLKPIQALMDNRVKIIERFTAGFAGLLILSAIIGCSPRATSELLNDTTSTQTAQANPDLSMPPDLRLPQPGSAPPPAAVPVTPAKPAKSAYAAPVNPVQGASAGAAQPQGDIYDQYGISKVNADGTKKSDDQLREELRQVIIARKKQQNPNYGSVYNIGNIFGGG